jgi:hypothetical protein
MLLHIFRDVLTAFLVCASTISASTFHHRADYALKERHHVPRSWSRVGPAPSQHKIQLHIGVKQGNFSELERNLYEGNVLRLTENRGLAFSNSELTETQFLTLSILVMANTYQKLK